MAQKQFTVDINLSNQSLIAAKIYPLTTASRNGLSLGAGDSGLLVFDTDLSQLYAWSGTAWNLAVTPASGAMTYKGTYASLVTAPSGAVDGDLYYMTVAGTLTWAGITFSPSADVQIGDLVIRRNATNWDVLQGNTIPASETNQGIIQIATQAEVNTGTDDTKAVTSLKLTTWRTAKNIPVKFSQTGLTLVANTPLTVTHNLNLADKDAFTIRVCDSAGSDIGVDVDSVNVNSLTITSNVGLTNVKVAIIG